jgi:5-methylcytosine-specific restriction endonuclease McrA
MCQSHSNQLKNLGRKSHFWKGGIALLAELIRDLTQYNIWRNKVYERDEYRCQECYQLGGELNAHHIKEFSIILQEFLQTYSQFSPIEDKETLVRLAITYEPFWNITNGKTLCIKCHKKIYKKETIL